jgi:hypothetical protein
MDLKSASPGRIIQTWSARDAEGRDVPPTVIDLKKS